LFKEVAAEFGKHFHCNFGMPVVSFMIVSNSCTLWTFESTRSLYSVRPGSDLVLLFVGLFEVQWTRKREVVDTSDHGQGIGP
jgi:hypothetical protein